jgi:hypothetical protein
MSFDDWGWGEIETAPQPAAEVVLPEGRHSAQITHAEYGVAKFIPDKWKERNPEGWRLSLTLESIVAGRKYVYFADIPRHWKWLVDQVCEACGTTPEGGPDALCSRLVGCHVDVDTTIYQGKTRQKAQVERWYRPEAVEASPEPAAPARKPAARTPHQKAKAAAAEAGLPPDDDIPF